MTLSDAHRAAIAQGARRRWAADKMAGRTARGEACLTNCDRCGRQIKATALKTHRSRCFTTWEQFLEIWGSKLEAKSETGCLVLRGEGKLPTANGRKLARILCEMRIGRSLAPRTEVARHTCDNQWCVNWEHLIPGSHGDNMRDMYERGRAHFQTVEFAARRSGLAREAWARQTPEQRAARTAKMLETRKQRHGY